MSKKLSAQEAASIIESAFTPLRCSAEIWDHGYRIRFCIFNSKNEPLLQVREMQCPAFQDAGRLESLLDQVRDQIAHKGVELALWSLPVQSGTAT